MALISWKGLIFRLLNLFQLKDYTWKWLWTSAYLNIRTVNLLAQQLKFFFSWSIMFCFNLNECSTILFQFKWMTTCGLWLECLARAGSGQVRRGSCGSGAAGGSAEWTDSLWYHLWYQCLWYQCRNCFDPISMTFCTNLQLVFHYFLI